jgi:hypothetical protein
MNDTPKYAPTYGVVCLIDALGAKSYSDDETINFLESRKVIRKAMDDKVADQISSRSIKTPQIALFNDTIVIAIECAPDSEDERNCITAMAVIVRKLISDGISKGIFFRGAIGIGKFFVDLAYDTIIGQAVSDAANWYESSNFVGCILTPRLAFVLQKYFKEGEPTATGVYIPHHVSTKGGTKEMFCVNCRAPSSSSPFDQKDARRGWSFSIFTRRSVSATFPRRRTRSF